MKFPEEFKELTYKVEKLIGEVFVLSEKIEEFNRIAYNFSNKVYLEKNLNININELEWSFRVQNVLKTLGVWEKRIKDLITLSELEVIKTRQCGRKCLNEIKNNLQQFGLSLGMSRGFIEEIDASV